MRKFCYTLLFVCTFIACKKSQNATTPTSPGTEAPSIFGKWEWYKATQFFLTNITPQSTGKWWQISFNPDSTYYQTGTYFTMPDPGGHFNMVLLTFDFPPRQEPYMRLSSPNMIAPWHIGHRLISNDTLMLDFGSSHDGPVFYFVRK